MKSRWSGKKIVAYGRVSSKEQRDYGNSLASQKDTLYRYCDALDIEILKYFEEDCSAKDFERPVFNELIEFCKRNKGEVNVVLVQKWDRFSRHLGKALLMIEYFSKKFNIEINSIEQPIDYNVADHIVLLGIYLATPEAENTKISERTRMGTRQALKEGRFVNMQPVGYVKGKDGNGKPLMQPDPFKAELIKNLFLDFSTGIYSQQEILKMYNARGLKLTKSTLSRLLDNVLYIGKLIVPAYKDEPEQIIRALHLPIVSEEIFYLSQRVKHGSKKLVKSYDKRNPNFPLTGFLVCENCGQILYGSQTNNGKSKKNPKTYYYYQCNSKHRCPRYKNEIVHAVLEEVFCKIRPSEGVLRLFERILCDEYERVGETRKKDVSSIEKQLNEIFNQRSRLTTLFASDKITEEDYGLTMQGYRKKTAELEEMKAELKDYRKDLDKFISFGVSLLANMDKVYNNCNVEVKEKLLGSIFSEKLIFENNSFRTLPFNEAILLFSRYNEVYRRLQNKKGDSFVRVSHSVPGVGIEPTHLSTRV